MKFPEQYNCRKCGTRTTTMVFAVDQLALLAFLDGRVPGDKFKKVTIYLDLSRLGFCSTIRCSLGQLSVTGTRPCLFPDCSTAMLCFCFCSLRANPPCDDSLSEIEKTASQQQGKFSRPYQEEKPMVTTNSRRGVPETKTLDGSHHVCDGLRSSPPMLPTHSWKPYTGPLFDTPEPPSPSLSVSEEKMETATTAILARATVITISPRQNNNNSTSHYSNSPPPRPSNPTPYSHNSYHHHHHLHHHLHHHHHHHHNNNNTMPTADQHPIMATLPPQPRISRQPTHRLLSPPSPQPPQRYRYDSLEASYLLDHLRTYLYLPTSVSSTSAESYASQTPAQMLARLLITWPSVRRNLPRQNRMLARRLGRIDWAGAERGLPKGSEEREAVELWLDSGLELFGRWWGPWEPLETREQLGKRRLTRRPSPLRSSMSSLEGVPSSSAPSTPPNPPSSASCIPRKWSTKAHRERNKFRHLWKQ
ncbi:hypothetical protein VTJ83DRAFT_2123 [Remersonia thermophila]|uniref:Uncharacterized protein n=1 Tax=Remersonia thermophila TaxID=72144 RepID=A0ABR4DK51_9PEZI